MGTATSPVLRLIRRIAANQSFTQLPDEELLRRFRCDRDHAAFGALLARHGAMVFEVCRNVIGNEADAEDAFQATFLVLVQKAKTIRKHGSIASWLYGVAYRTALKARTNSASRQKREAAAPAQDAAHPADDPSWHEMRCVLHEELNRISDPCRAALVLCYLEGKTQDEAASQLGVSKATLRRRLEHARGVLRVRLVRRGLGAVGVLMAASWPMASASACLRPTLVSSTIKAATLFAAGKAASDGVISAKVAALTQGVMKTMFLTKLKTATATLLLAGLLVSGLVMAGLAARPDSLLAQGPTAQKEDEAPKAVVPSRTLKGDFPIADIAWAPDGDFLATVEHEVAGEGLNAQVKKTAVRLWDVRAGAVTRTLADDDLRKHCWRFVAVAPDGKTVAASSEGNDGDLNAMGVVKVWDTATGELKHTLKHTLFPRPLAFAPDGKTLATGTGGNVDRDFPTVQLWDVRTGKLRRTGETTNKWAVRLAFAPDGKTLAAVLGSGERETAASEVTLWDTAEGKLLRTVPDSDGFHTVAFAADGKSLLGAARGKLRMWDVATGQTRQASDIPFDQGSVFAFAPDGKTLATAGRQEDPAGEQGGKYLVMLWDVKAAKLVQTLEGPKAFIYCLAFSRDGKTLASGSQDGSILLWDFDRAGGPEGRGDSGAAGLIYRTQAADEKAKDGGLSRQVEKVLKAHGGEAKLTKLNAYTKKVVSTSADGDTTITVTYSVQQPEQYRGEGETQIKSKGISISSVTVYNGENAWRKIGDGETTDNSVLPGFVKYFGPRAILRLKDFSSKLTPVDETTVNERAAFGLAMALQAGGKELELYFDKETGLLVKEVLMAADGAETETLYSDYKEFDGIPVAQKETVKVNGQVRSTTEVTEFTIRDKLDAKLFQKP